MRYTQMEKWDPAKRLSFIADRIKKQNEAQHAQQHLENHWQGIAFVCGNEAFILPLAGMLEEIIACPTMIAIPWVKSWFLGVSNLRGNMLPITDLAYLLSGKKTPIEKYTPVLVLCSQGECLGILVKKLLGLYTIDNASPVPFSLSPTSVFSKYSSEIIQKDADFFPILNFEKLMDDPVFSNL